MLADDLAEAVADLGAAVAVPVGRLGRKLLRLARGPCRLGNGPDLLSRTDADPVSFAEGTIDGTSLRHTHLCAVHQRRNVGRIGISVADETLAVGGRVYSC